MRQGCLGLNLISLPCYVCSLVCLEASVLTAFDRHHVVLWLVNHTQALVRLVLSLLVTALTVLALCLFSKHALHELNRLVTNKLRLGLIKWRRTKD